MTPIDIGLSFASSSAADSGKTGAFSISGGGTRQQQTLYVVGAVAAVLALVAWLKFR